MPETMWHCSGAHATVTKKGVEVIFVRSYFKDKKPKVDYPIQSETTNGKTTLYVVIPQRGKDRSTCGTVKS